MLKISIYCIQKYFYILFEFKVINIYKIYAVKFKNNISIELYNI